MYHTLHTDSFPSAGCVHAVPSERTVHHGGPCVQLPVHAGGPGVRGAGPHAQPQHPKAQPHPPDLRRIPLHPRLVLHLLGLHEDEAAVSLFFTVEKCI